MKTIILFQTYYNTGTARFAIDFNPSFDCGFLLQYQSDRAMVASVDFIEDHGRFDALPEHV